MWTWTKLVSVFAAVVCCSSITMSSSNARAEEPENTTESSEALTTDSNDDFDIEPSRESEERRLYSVDRDWHRRGYGGCYRICSNLREDCMRRYFRGGYDEWRGRRNNRWDRRYGWSNAYRRCERRFDYCIESCRGSRFRDR